MSNAVIKTKATDIVKSPVVKASVKELVIAEPVKVPVDDKTHTLLTIEEVVDQINNAQTKTVLVDTPPPIEEEPAPTDRQIKNAERILRAAGRDSETVAAEAVARALENKQESGILSIDGIVQTPLLTGVTVERNRLNTENSDYALYIPYFLNITDKSKTFSIYHVTIDKCEVIYALDNSSTVELSAATHGIRPFHRNKLTTAGSLLLINSSSKNDVIIGDNALSNAATSNCLLNSSTIFQDDAPKENYGLPWPELTRMGEFTPNQITIKDSQFKRSTVQNSTVSPGTYIDARVRDANIESTTHANFTRVDIWKCRINATRTVLIRDAQLHSCGFTSESDLIIESSRFSNIYASVPSINIPNKFSYLELDAPWGILSLVRASRSEFSLGTSHYRQERFKLNVSRETILEFVKAQADTMSWTEGKVTNTLITDSIAEYLVDSIMSRLAVINLLDSALQLAQEMTGFRSTYEDPYSAS